MKLRHLLLLPCLACAGHAHADVYKHVDADGNVTYSNKPIKGGRKIELAPLPTVKVDEGGNGDYEHVKRTTQRNRDESRRKVLEDELAAEEKLLAEARQTLQDAQDKPHLSQPDGNTFRDAGGQQEDARNAQEQVDLHERNVKALKQELSGIK